MSQLCASSPFLTLSLPLSDSGHLSGTENYQLRSFNISSRETFTGRVGRADTEALYTSMGVFLKNTYSYSDLEKKKVEFWNTFANMQLHNHSKRWWPLSVRTHWPVWIIQNSQCHWRVYNETCGNAPCVALDVHLLFILLFCCQQT